MRLRESAAMNPRYIMLAGATLVVGIVILIAASRGHDLPRQQPAGFDAKVITTGLDTPWDMIWGPDSMIWVSERGGRISRIDPRSGRRTTLGEVAGVAQQGESGLMGIALHPDFPRTPWVYAMHTYDSGGLHNRLVRLRWTGSSFDDQQVLLDGIPGNVIHNGSRVVVGPDRMLYITTGDAGNAGQAQDSTALGGKILRLDLDGKVPADNPFHSPIWSWGHRNGQGLVFHGGVLYETEHGPSENDEVNLIRRGANYGWPDNARGVAPLTSWTPTVAITGADFYRGDLLATSLNGRTLWRMTLSPDGARITSRAPILSGVYGRLRDVLVAVNGDIFICTSNRDGRGAPTDGDDRIIRLTPRR
jgi:glucose/arabinose dehydrogenase